MNITKFIPNEEAMMALGAELAKTCQPGDIIFLEGNLGAGKTTLVRGFLRALGHQGNVKSPTYTLIEPYELKHFRVYHMDLYRLEGEESFHHIGLDDYLTSDAICLIEWPEKAGKSLPKCTLRCTISIKETGREVCLQQCH